MKVIFMGTPDFSVGTLEALVEAGHDVCLAVTQPDKPKGRGKEMQFTPVKETAVRHNIPVYQPKKIRDPQCVEELEKYHADVMVVVAFGQILPKSILEMTPYGCINVHASLLPKYRGAAPIQWSIIEGETVHFCHQFRAGNFFREQAQKDIFLIQVRQSHERLRIRQPFFHEQLFVRTVPVYHSDRREQFAQLLASGAVCLDQAHPYPHIGKRRCKIIAQGASSNDQRIPDLMSLDPDLFKEQV